MVPRPRASGQARTAVDIARDTDRLEVAVAAFDSALRMGVPRDELRRVFAPCRSWPGARLVAQAIDLADGRADNPRVVQPGGPGPARTGTGRTEVEVHDEEGLIGYADFGWHGVLGEFDSKGKHGLYDDEARPAQGCPPRGAREDPRGQARVNIEVVRGDGGLAAGVLGGRVRAAMARAVARGLRAA